MFAMQNLRCCGAGKRAILRVVHSATMVGNMQAIIQQRYGEADVLQLSAVDTPAPAANEVRVRISAAAVTAADTLMRRGAPWYGRLILGLFKPKCQVTGTGFSGVVDQCGRDVSDFEVGDRVYGESVLGGGTHCEYVCVPEQGVIAHSPEGVPDDELATVCDGIVTSCHFLFDLAGIQPGQRVLINGAAGSLGSAAVQLARIAGAHVTAVCSSHNHPFVIELGADAVIDYRTVDFTRRGKKNDVIYDAVGKQSFHACRSVLSPSGIYLSPVLSLPLLCTMLWTKHTGGQKALFAAVGLLEDSERRDMLARINQWLVGGKLRCDVEHRFDMADISDAHRLIETGHRRGNVVLRIGQ